MNTWRTGKHVGQIAGYFISRHMKDTNHVPIQSTSAMSGTPSSTSMSVLMVLLIDNYEASEASARRNRHLHGRRSRRAAQITFERGGSLFVKNTQIISHFNKNSTKKLPLSTEVFCWIITIEQSSN